MPPHGIFPLQVVDLVIGELAVDHEKQVMWFPFHKFTNAGEALRSCALVSKKWASRSRAHLFEKVTVQGREGRPTLLPPPSILPHIKKLEVICSQQSSGFWPPHEPSIPDLLKVFLTAPSNVFELLGEHDQRVCIQEFIDARSTTLRTVEFKYCSLSTHNISDMVLGNHCIKRLHLADCNSERLPAGHPITDTPGLGARSNAVEPELYISGGGLGGLFYGHGHHDCSASVSVQ